jgi:hypothetical protein
MRHSLLSAAVVAALSIGAASASAGTLLYSFESTDAAGPTDGFAANGGGITVSQATTGATVGSNSMENVSVSGATFTGALTGSDVPAALSDPSTTSISLDLTIAPGQQFAGAFADIGITIFGALGSGATETFGNQYQVDASSEQNVDLAPGTYSLNIPLIGTDPSTFALSQPYSEVLGNGFIPTGFEFFYSKSNDAPLSVFVDNVQAVAVPEPASIGLGAISGLMMLARRRRKI